MPSEANWPIFCNTKWTSGMRRTPTSEPTTMSMYPTMPTVLLGSPRFFVGHWYPTFDLHPHGDGLVLQWNRVTMWNHSRTWSITKTRVVQVMESKDPSPGNGGGTLTWDIPTWGWWGWSPRDDIFQALEATGSTLLRVFPIGGLFFGGNIYVFRFDVFFDFWFPPFFAFLLFCFSLFFVSHTAGP